jgi:hypothetical protein
MYKLETYQKNFPNFIYGNPTSKKISGQDEGTKKGPMEHQDLLRNHKTLEMEQFKRRK